ncbi:MAG: DUF5686 family protein [Candidatus Zixiibacteriota bacterium]
MIRSTLILALLFMTRSLSAGVLTGTIYDADDSLAIGFATVSIENTGQSISSNESGMYRLRLEPGTYELKFSHVSHYSQTIEVAVDDSAKAVDIYLKPAVIDVGLIKVYDRQYDAAQRIIVEAIARKEQLLSQIKEYSFDAYTKLVARDTSKADSSSVVAIFESQVEAFWKYPDDFKEIILARKQTTNIPAEGNLLQVGQLTNFNANRIDFGRYSIVSPTATDALDNYEYYLIDTIFTENSAVFVLEIEPKNQTDALFEGTIKIADSTYAVVGVELTLNKGFDNPYLSNISYRQVYALFEGKYWMPTMIQSSASLDFNLPILPPLSIDYQAALHNFRFEPGFDDSLFGEYVLEVHEAADDIDSIKWDVGRLIPLTPLEQRGYFFVDSVKNHQPLYMKLLIAPFALSIFVLSAQDFIHFNKVEGPYLGFGQYFRNITDRLGLRVKTGYAFDADLWQHEYGFDYTVSKRQKLTFGAQYRDKIRTRPTIFARPDGNATLMALLTKIDAYDYFAEEGFLVKMGLSPLPKTGLYLTYNDFDQKSVRNNSEYSVFNNDELNRPNPSIVDGKLRSISALLTYDSRPRFRDKKGKGVLLSFPSTEVRFFVEHASDDLFDNDFEFTRYSASLQRMDRLFGWAISNLYVFAGASDGSLPPQKYFVADFDAGLTEHEFAFKTMAETNFYGNRALVVYGSIDFGSKLFQKSGLPLIKKIPLGLSLYGGAFWTDFHNHPYHTGDELLLTAKKPYGEAGFGIDRLVPLPLTFVFTWQLSDYPTNRWTWGVSWPVF